MKKKELNQVIQLDTDMGEFDITMHDLVDGLNEHGYTIVKVYDIDKQIN